MILGPQTSEWVDSTWTNQREMMITITNHQGTTQRLFLALWLQQLTISSSSADYNLRLFNNSLSELF